MSADDAGEGRRSWFFWALRGLVAVAAGLAVWLVGFRTTGSEPPPVIDQSAPGPGAPTEVLATADIDPLYVIELRGRPDYRIMRYEPRTGEASTAFAIPEESVVYAIDRHPTEQVLALSYTENYLVEGSGLYLLDLTDGSLPRAVVAEEEGRFFTDVSFSPDGSTLWVTVDDQRSGTQQLSVASADIDSGELVEEVADAVDPVQGDGWVAYLEADDEGARRSVGLMPLDGGAPLSFEVADGELDLGTLLYDEAAGTCCSAPRRRRTSRA